MKISHHVTFSGTKHAYTYFTAVDAVEQLRMLALTRKDTLIAIDLETYARASYKGDVGGGLVAFKSKIRTLQLHDGFFTYILDFMGDKGEYLLLDPEVVNYLQTLLLNNKTVAHYAVFETSHLQNLFKAHDLPMKPLNIRCTQTAYRLSLQAQTPESASYSTSLANVCQMVLSESLFKDSQLSDWSVHELTTEQLDYCALDAIVPYKLIKELAVYIAEYGMNEVYMLNVRAQEPIAQMKNFGLPIDKAEHRRQWESWEVEKEKYKLECLGKLNPHLVRMSPKDIVDSLLLKITKSKVEHAKQLIHGYVDEDIHSQLSKLYDLESFLMVLDSTIDKTETDKELKSKKRSIRRILKNIKLLILNPDSCTQVSEWLQSNLSKELLTKWPRTDSGNALKTDYEAFTDFSDVKELASIVGYKTYSKLCGTYGKGWDKMITWNGEYHSLPVNLHIAKTDTGRLSSSEPNLQTAPAPHKNKDFRNMFTSTGPDYRLLCADFSQIELRVAALISEDPDMLSAYEDEIDLHYLTASKISGVPIKDITKPQRQGAKSINFGLAFGAGADSLRIQAKNSYRVIMSQEEAELAVVAFRDAYPRYREWQLEQSRGAEYNGFVKTVVGKHRLLGEQTYTTSMNTPVQGTSAEIMLQSLYYIQLDLWDQKLDANIVLTVHDEILLNCHVDVIDRVKKIVEAGMTKSFLWVFPHGCTKLLVECGIGKNWNEAK